MKPYRKTDQEYYDDYDRDTIKYLKEIEKEESSLPPKTVTFEGEMRVIPGFITSNFRDKAIFRSRERESSVRERIRKDEDKDRVVASYRVPEGIKCDTCGTRMFLNGHAFDFKGYKLLFMFDCPKKTHKSRKMVHPDGDVVIFPMPTCEDCGGDLTYTSEEKGFITILTDTCNSCGKKEVMEFDMTPDAPLTEADLEKYCKQFIGDKTFIEDLDAVIDFVNYYKIAEAEKEEKEKYEVEKIEKITIPKLKERLIVVCQEAGYSDFGMEKPDMGKNVVIEFNVQDQQARGNKLSAKTLCKLFNETLLTTNWRLQNSSVSCRMGYLTGKLKGYEDPEGLLQLAKEIKEKSSKKA